VEGRREAKNRKKKSSILEKTKNVKASNGNEGTPKTFQTEQKFLEAD
jgi:hypothetical protein